MLYQTVCGAFFKLVISLPQTKCSYTILYCTVGCQLASKSSCDLAWSDVSLAAVVSGNTQVREDKHSEWQILKQGNSKGHQFEYTSLRFSWDKDYNFLVNFGLNYTVLHSLTYWWLQIPTWCLVLREHTCSSLLLML